MLVCRFARRLVYHQSSFFHRQSICLELKSTSHPPLTALRFSTTLPNFVPHQQIKNEGGEHDAPETTAEVATDGEEETRQVQVRHIGNQDKRRTRVRSSRTEKNTEKLLNSIPLNLRHDSSCSGYGWTVAVPINSSSQVGKPFFPKALTDKIQFRKWIETDVSPWQMLQPYESPLLVILVTTEYVYREFIHALVKQIVRKVYPHNIEGLQEMHVLLACVDKVSIPAGATNELPSEMLSEGAAGISFFWTSQDKLILEYEKDNKSDLLAKEDKVGCLLVRLHDSKLQNSRSIAGYSQFKVNLVNTAFATGRDHTMSLMKLVLDRSIDENTHKELVSIKVREIRHLDNRDIRLDINSLRGHLKMLAHSEELRTELTPWRSVAEISGNVIKRLQGDDGPMPASTELERAISKLAPAEHGRFEVWAEVASKTNISVTPLLTGSGSSSVFIKVVGGGGGWGEKMGLICLDPNSVPSVEVSDHFDINNIFPSSCQPGDKLRFLKVATQLAEMDQVQTSTASPKSYGSCIEEHGYTTFGFGTSGSPKVERVTSAAATSNKPSFGWKPTIFGHFGAMSQRMYYERSASKQAEGSGIISEPDKSIYKTELPPYTHYSTGGDLLTSPSMVIERQDSINHATAEGVENNPEMSFLWSTQPAAVPLPNFPGSRPVKFEDLYKDRGYTAQFRSFKSKSSDPDRRPTGRSFKRLPLGSKQPLIRDIVTDVKVEKPEQSDWAREELLILDNLKANAPQSASNVVTAQLRRYNSLFKDVGPRKRSQDSEEQGGRGRKHE